MRVINIVDFVLPQYNIGVPGAWGQGGEFVSSPKILNLFFKVLFLYYVPNASN